LREKRKIKEIPIAKLGDIYFWQSEPEQFEAAIKAATGIMRKLKSSLNSPVSGWIFLVNPWYGGYYGKWKR